MEAAIWNIDAAHSGTSFSVRQLGLVKRPGELRQGRLTNHRTGLMSEYPPAAGRGAER